ncbi:MAG: hypothetical protein ACYDBZ_10910 [Steroidobacteraceae bacterium]
MNYTAGKHIDDLHRVIAKAGEDHAPTLGIDRKVIEAALNARQRYLLNFAHRGCFSFLALRDGAQSDERPGANQGAKQMTI